MPFYRVLVQGRNLRIPGEGGAPGITGFFTSRVVYAGTRSQAESKALGSVQTTWRQSQYLKQPGAEALALAVSDIHESGWLQWLRSPRSGHTFYSETSPGEA